MLFKSSFEIKSTPASVNHFLIKVFPKIIHSVLNLKSKMLSHNKFAVFCGICFAVLIQVQGEVNEDAHLNATQLLTKYGYSSQAIEITTEDGYILTIHRIPNGKQDSSSNPEKPVVIVDHGFISSSDNWILSGPGKGLAYVLSDAGYDVWLMNARGNTYSRRHKRLSPNGLEFWDFSFHEMALYDLPAVIDTALRTSGQSKVQYVGYDLTASKVVALLSLKPEYNNKIKLVSVMGATVYGRNMRGPLKLLGLATAATGQLIDPLVIGELIPERLVNSINAVAPAACTPELIAATLCQAPVYLVSGFDPDQANSSLVPIIYGHQTSTSTKTFMHFLQSTTNPTFRQYNYGPIKNLFIYRRLTPPDYNLKNVKVPFALYYGDNDLLADKRDIARLYKALPNAVLNYRVPYDKWTHVDFTEGIDAPKLAYAKVISVMARYN